MAAMFAFKAIHGSTQIARTLLSWSMISVRMRSLWVSTLVHSFRIFL